MSGYPQLSFRISIPLAKVFFDLQSKICKLVNLVSRDLRLFDGWSPGEAPENSKKINFFWLAAA